MRIYTVKWLIDEMPTGDKEVEFSKDFPSIPKLEKFIDTVLMIDDNVSDIRVD